MTKSQRFMKVVAASCVGLLLSLATFSIAAAPISVPASSSQTAINQIPGARAVSIALVTGKSRLHKFKDPVSRISIGDPTVADVMVVNPQELYLLGKKPGSTNVLVWHAGDKTTAIDVMVGADTAAVQALFKQLMPDQKQLRVTAAGESLVLSGQVSDAVKVQQAIQIAEEYSGKKVMNMLSTDHLPQVLIEVKIAEVNKDVLDRLGLNVSGTDFAFAAIGGATMGATSPVAGLSANAAGKFGNTNAWLQAQITSGAMTILAEPNIMAISGQEGRFLAGGKVFMPVPQSNAVGGSSVITLQEEPYGVGIRFTPTVLNGGRINLRVQPEVSEVSQQGIPVVAGGTTVVMPNIITRQASTTVQLYDGQSFAIGGLIKNKTEEVISAFPGLASIPIIGALFRSSSYSAGRTELLIIVTPRIVQPLGSPPQLPTDKFTPPTQSEFFLQGKMEGSKPSTTNAQTQSQEGVNP